MGYVMIYNIIKAPISCEKEWNALVLVYVATCTENTDYMHVQLEYKNSL